MKRIITLVTIILSTQLCFGQTTKDSFYYKKIAEEGVKFISVYNGKYKVFTQKVGDGKIKLLLLHGGPVNTHEYFEIFPQNLRNQGIEIYYYDQLGSYYSDQPKDTSIWNVNRFVDEVEEVRKGLNLEKFYILGHSWGAMLAELYAAKFPNNLEGVILSNVRAVIRDTSKMNYHKNLLDDEIYSKVKSLPVFATLPVTVLDSIGSRQEISDTALNAKFKVLFRSMLDSIVRRDYNCRLAVRPEPLLRNGFHINRKDRDESKIDWKIYEPDYPDAMEKIKCPVLIIGGAFDRMSQALYPEMKSQFVNTKVRIYICPNGSHFSMWDDTQNYFKEVIRFLKEVDTKLFDPEK